VLRRCEAVLGILENTSVREQRYNAQKALESIWNYSGEEEDFDSDENDDESYELASEDKSGQSEDASSSNEDNIAQDSAESRDDEASNEGDGRNPVNRVGQRLARQQQAPLVW